VKLYQASKAHVSSPLRQPHLAFTSVCITAKECGSAGFRVKLAIRGYRTTQIPNANLWGARARCLMGLGDTVGELIVACLRGVMSSGPEPLARMPQLMTHASHSRLDLAPDGKGSGQFSPSDSPITCYSEEPWHGTGSFTSPSFAFTALHYSA
jgi:hypothetical protein